MTRTYAVFPSRARSERGRAAFRVAARRFARRLRALVRLLARRRRDARRYDDLRHLDERTLRDLGVTRSELASVVAELGGRASASRRRTDVRFWTSATSTFHVPSIDTRR
jgi:uncharacterized protein YjiS (DUF1127 family)